MKLLNILSNNSKGIDNIEAESKIRNEYANLLGPNEHIEHAFKYQGDIRDKNYFTTHRILLKNGKGIGRKRNRFTSIPYQSIKAFSVQTAGGSAVSVNTSLKIWCDDCVETILFAKDSVDLFEVQQYFNGKVFLQTRKAGTSITTTDEKLEFFSSDQEYLKQATNTESVFNWIGNDNVQIDPKYLQDRFGSKSQSPILMPDEQVEIAYQARRDIVIITPTRFLLIDVKGISGRKIEFFSMRWQCVKAYSVETAGRFDRDGDFVLHTNLSHYRRVEIDLRQSKTDVYQVQMALSNKLLGGDTPNERIPNVDQHKGHVDPGASLIGGGNMRPLDAIEVERVYRSSPCLLQDDENVEMAFLGRRDLVIFTTKRIIEVDVKGFSGKKVKYTSFPYSSVLAFEVTTAGKHDRDAEVKIYTEIKYICPPESEHADPGLSYIEWDFNKNVVDVLDLKRYLNTRLLATERGMRVPTGLLVAAAKENGMSKILSTLGEDQRTIDANELDTLLHTSIDVLLDDEHVVMAFKAGRDISCFTNKRIFVLDKKGWSGQKVAYVSIPYSSVRAFSAESAGGWDRDSTVKIYTKNYWNLGTLKLDFRKGKVDIIAIQNFLSAIIIGNEKDAASYLKTVNSDTVKISHPEGMNGFTDMLVDFSVEEDPKTCDAQLHSDPPILLDHERVEKVYREGRDLWVYTTLRILTIDVKGLSGGKIKYTTIPFEKSAKWFAVETAGHLDFDAECYVFTDMPDLPSLMQKVLVKRGDIFDMHEYLGNRLLFGATSPSVPNPNDSDAYVPAHEYDNQL
mmetsp:Transcript_23204/g.54870  ORF Transcript_23204/g.54870 Transcript_23204/m.54870 type:complete len:793 (+) Transcript_23204:72-2450(+)|eukprot:CAMPEP_0197195068 /NCGR_PEP_ID=MMETSP1423-20130617/30380_1 /TAXON_ID=476441 /ORGANISM="Pseudo-nitzschia heimii, Strain UNC1101" /LENGTH=792 /DNA_ID=CAMNT_0042648605 /DNA_START=8 /DNA_END=2386 /DNA_ORIENTATION=+